MARLPLGQKKKMIATCVAIYTEMMILLIEMMILLMQNFSMLIVRVPKSLSYTFDNSALERMQVRLLNLRTLINGNDLVCVDNLRMNKHCFYKLCEMLRDVGGLVGNKNMSIEEMVSIFLYILAHNTKNRRTQLYFRRSGETISRHFNTVLNAALKCHHLLLKKPQSVTGSNFDYKWKWFKNCLGALDGTHIKVCVPDSDKVSFISYLEMDRFNVGHESSNIGKRKTKSGSNSSRVCMRWSQKEDRALVASLVELVNMKGWKQDNGQFRSGYQVELERLMREKIPNCQMQAQPHIDSRVKILRKQYHVIAEMRGPRCSGFGWDDGDKCITCDDEVWEEWIKSHPSAAGLRKKPFPFYDELDYVYGKDRATGLAAENPADAVENLQQEEPENQSQHESDYSPFVDVREFISEQEETSPDAPNIPSPSIQTTQATPSNCGKKRKRNDSMVIMQEISAEMSKAIQLMAKAGEHVGRLANCFKHESEGVDRRMAVNAEVMKVEGLTQDEIIKVGRKIALDPMETDYFFSLPEDFRKTYVLSLLLSD